MEQKDNLNELKYIQPDSEFLNDDLFIPSEKVWNKIEFEINPEKKKRKFFWFWLCGILLFGSLFLIPLFFKLNNNPASTNVSKNIKHIDLSNDKKLENPNINSRSLELNKKVDKDFTIINEISENRKNGNQKINSSSKINESSISSNQINKTPVGDKKNLSTNIHSNEKTKLSYLKNDILLNESSTNKSNLPKVLSTRKKTSQLSEKSKFSRIAINNSFIDTSNYTMSESNRVLLNQDIKQEKSQIKEIFQYSFLESMCFIDIPIPEQFSIQFTAKPSKIKIQKFPYYLGGFIGKSFRSYFKNKLTDNLSETIEKSYTNPNYILNLSFSQPFQNKWSYHIGLEYFQQRIYTDYDLNIPYNLMTEKQFSTMEATNEFIHSLPTYQGNISTDLIVTRSTSTPITHNENINVNLVTEGLSRTLQVPLGVQYHFSHYSKEFSLGLQVVPGLDFDRSINIVEAKSFHTYVKEKDLIIKVEDTKSRFLLGYGIFSGYRFNLSKYHCIDSHIEYRLNQINKSYIGNLGIKLGIQGLFF